MQKLKNFLFISLVILPLLLSMMIWGLFYLINKTDIWDKKLSSTFECGFLSLHPCRYSFSIPYYYLGIVFLFLDLELCLILPLMISQSSNLLNLLMIFVILVMVIGTLFLEWKTGLINWLE